MTHRTTIVGERPVFSESTILDAIASELLAIKTADKLSWNDIAAVLGVSDVQAAKYVDKTAKMSAVTFARGKREWNGRFTGAFDRLCVESRPTAHEADRTRQSKVLKAALALSIALEDDDQIDAEEVRQNRATIEGAIDALQGLLGKLSMRGAA